MATVRGGNHPICRKLGLSFCDYRGDGLGSGGKVSRWQALSLQKPDGPSPAIRHGNGTNHFAMSPYRQYAGRQALAVRAIAAFRRWTMSTLPISMASYAPAARLWCKSISRSIAKVCGTASKSVPLALLERKISPLSAHN